MNAIEYKVMACSVSVTSEVFCFQILIIIIASHDNEMNDIYNDKIYMRRNDTVK